MSSKTIIAAFAGVVIVGGITSGTMFMKKTTNPGPLQITVHSDRLSTYQTLADIDNDAELVIQGKAVRTDPAKEIRTALDQNNQVIKELPGNLYTDAHVLVTKIWKGDQQLMNKEIIVRQLGGQNKKFIQNSDDDILLEQNEEVVLFLERSRVREGLPEGDGWTILGAGAGHGTLHNGKVSFAVADPFTKEFDGSGSIPFDKVLDQFYSIVNKRRLYFLHERRVVPIE